MLKVNKKLIKRIFGIDKIEAAKEAAEKEHAETLARIAEAKVKEEEAKKAEEEMVADAEDGGGMHMGEGEEVAEASEIGRASCRERV